MITSTAKQPLSAMAYVVIVLVGLFIAFGATFSYIHFLPKLVESTAQGQVFYLLLISWALVCSGFYFGVMRTYAWLTYKHMGSVLEVGGPLVVGILVVIGGFWLPPAPPETFDLAVRAFSADVPLITSGQVTLDLPGLPHATIGPDGEANFKGLSAKWRGKLIRVLPKVDGFEDNWLTPTIDRNILTVELVRSHPKFLQRATLVPPPKAADIQIRVDGEKIDSPIDELGGFTFTATGKADDRVLVEVFLNQRLVARQYQVLSPKSIDIHWKARH